MHSFATFGKRLLSRLFIKASLGAGSSSLKVAGLPLRFETKMPASKKSSLESVPLAVQQHKNEVPDKKTVMVKKIGEMKTTEKQ